MWAAGEGEGVVIFVATERADMGAGLGVFLGTKTGRTAGDVETDANLLAIGAAKFVVFTQSAPDGFAI